MSQKNEAVKNIVAGSVAGIAEAVATWPSENIKTQMQFKGNHLNMKNTAFEIYKKDGFFGFYRGLTPVLFFNIPKVASRFYAYNIFSKHLQEKSYSKDSVSILSGLFAGFVESTLITVPSETIKTKMIRFPHMKTMDVVRESGIRGLYLGYFPTLYRQSLNQASRFYFFNKYKDYISSREKFTSSHSFLGGVGAGIFSVIIPYKEEERFIDMCAEVELFPIKVTRVKGSHKTQIVRSLLAFKRYELAVLVADELVIEINRHEYTDDYIELTKAFYLKM